MNHLKSFKLFEIASITEPNIIYIDPKSTTLSFIKFMVDSDEYYMYISLYNINNEEILSVTDINTIEIGFDLIPKRGDNKNKLTNKNIPLKVLANVVGVIKYWSSLDISEDINDQEINLKDVNISFIKIDSKCETEDDLRRNNIYNYYIEKLLNAKIIKKKSKKQIGSNNRIPIHKTKTYMTIYEIEPTNIRSLIKIN